MAAIPKFEAIELGPIDARFAMLNNGYEPIPVWEKKRPVHSNWQNMSITHDEILGWRGVGPHTGLRTKHMPVFDIDILDGEAAIVVENVVRNFLGDRGEVLVRIGLAPKRAVPLRTDVPFKKIIVRLVAPNGNPHKIEVLGSGQQVVVAGIHPDTNRPYLWREGRSPINTPRQKLPLVTEADVRALLDECIKVTGDDTDDGVVTPFEPLEERLKKTEYKGSHSINQAILDIPLIRLSEGVVIEDIIKECMEVVRLAWSKLPDDHPDKETWDWNTQRSQIEASVYGAFNLKIKENPRIVGALPDLMLKKWREIEERGGTPTLKKRRYWGVEDLGPAEPLPEMKPPPKEQSQKQSSESKYPHLEFIKVSDLFAIPPREFYLGKQYQRGAVSGTMAPGGRGKSSLVLVEAVAMATGRSLLNEEPLRRLKVWYHNGEENWDELCRRLEAACHYYGVTHAELEGWLCLTNPQRFPLRVAEVGSGDRFVPDRNLLAHMYEEIRTNEFEVVSLDPLITLHGVPESNPVMMRGVMDIFRDMAASLNCSTEVVGHTRKPPIGFDGELTAYDTRGSGAIVDALRSVRMLNLMTSSEAEEAGVQEYERERHVRVTPAKRNYSATAAPPNWIKIENLLISNGDDVGVVIPWTWPGHDPAAFEAAVRRAEGIFIEVATRLIKRGHRLSDKGGRNYAPKLIAQEPEAMESRVGETALKAAMERLIDVGTVRVFDGYKAGKPVHELEIAEGGSNAT
jgi:hypothetical protein